MILDDPNVLLASFGVKMFTNELGNMVLVSYGHASPSFENDPGALSSACDMAESKAKENIVTFAKEQIVFSSCLLYTSPSPRDRQKSRMPSSA